MEYQAMSIHEMLKCMSMIEKDQYLQKIYYYMTFSNC